MRSKACEQRIEAHMDGRLHDLERLWTSYCNGNQADSELGSLDEYGLCFDYVAPDTYHDQPEAYFRYQLSWGGPGDEFRFYANPDFSCHRIEYWFLDWFDGAQRTLSGEGEALLLDIWRWFCDTGAVRSAMRSHR
jgi:hypothetical protein